MIVNLSLSAKSMISCAEEWLVDQENITSGFDQLSPDDLQQNL